MVKLRLVNFCFDLKYFKISFMWSNGKSNGQNYDFIPKD